MVSGRVIVGGIGYRNLRDHSAGVYLADRLMDQQWPESVVVEDLSYCPVAVAWRLLEEPDSARFARAIFVAAVERGRTPGAVVAYRWDGALPEPEEVQRCVSDAVTGVIHLDSSLVVTRQLEALPDDVAVVEIEPLLHEFGEAFSAPVAAGFQAACHLVTELALDPHSAAALPRAPLGGVRAHASAT